MRHFRHNGTTYGYDETVESQLPLIQKAVDAQWEEIANWPPAISVDEFAAICETKLQAALDAGAASWGYDTLLSAASYANSLNPAFKAEATVLIAWRDDVWVWAATVVSNIKAGKVALPDSPDLVLAVMPPMPARPIIAS